MQFIAFKQAFGLFGHFDLVLLFNEDKNGVIVQDLIELLQNQLDLRQFAHSDLAMTAIDFITGSKSPFAHLC